MLLLENGNGVLLTRRPAQGIWAGLWSLPECSREQDPAEWAREALGLVITDLHRGIPLRHEFTHYSLEIYPVHARVEAANEMREGEWVWYNAETAANLGLPAPVQRLLREKETRP